MLTLPSLARRYGKRLPPSSASGTEYTAPDLESLHPEKREAKLYAPLYNGLAAGLALVFMVCALS